MIKAIRDSIIKRCVCSVADGNKVLLTRCCGPQEPEEQWGQGPDAVGQLQGRIQQLETENTDFLAALEDAMEQYKQQVRRVRAVVRPGLNNGEEHYP